MRPTRRSVLLFALAVPLSLVMVTADPALWPWSFDYGALVLLATASDALLALPRRRLAWRVATPATLSLGRRGSLALTLTAPRSRRRVRLEALGEQKGALEPPAPVAGELAPGSPLELGLALVPRRRGRIAVERIWLRWWGPLGLIEVTTRLPVDRAIDVIPDLGRIQGAALRFTARDAPLGSNVQRQGGEGSEFEALRDHAAGLDPRHIDWKHSARHRKLLAKEFRTERNHSIVLAFDTGYLMQEPLGGMPRLDHAIEAGLALAYVSLRGGDLVGSFGFDAAVRHYQGPVRGVAGFARLLRATAALEYHPAETNFTLGLAELAARLRRRALVVLFTDFVDTVGAELLVESLERAASRHVVIFVSFTDPALRRTAEAAPHGFPDIARAVVAGDFLREREIVLERLARLGVHCLDVPGPRLPPALIERYLLIKQRGLL